MDFINAILGSEAFIGALLTLITAVIGVAVNRGVAAFEAATGIQIEDKRKRDLNDALNSGAAAALKHGAGAGVETMKAHAIAYARQSVPEAIRELTPGDTVLDDLAEAKVRDVLGRFGIAADK